MQAASVYVHSDAYFHTIDKLEALARNFDPAAPDDLRTKIIEIVSDHGDVGIWPMSIFNGEDEGEVIVVAS